MSTVKAEPNSEDLVTVPTQSNASTNKAVAGDSEFAEAAGEDRNLTSADSRNTVAAVEKLQLSIREIMREADGLAYPDTTVAGTLDYLVRRTASPDITYVYIIDEQRILLGVVALRDLLMAKPGQLLGEIMTKEPFAFSPDTNISEAVSQTLRTHYRLYPVTDSAGKMVGMVYAWQLFEKVAEVASAQPGNMVGLNKEERISTSVGEALRMRHPWLQVNLLTAFTAALVVGFFEDTIAQIIVLAVFLPVLAGQSGNTGCQALAITLRGLTLGELQNYSIRKLYFKEITLGALNGLGVGLIAASAMFIYATNSGADNPAMLGIVILLAMTGACMCSGLFGVLVPLTLKKFGADPAMASSIFLTTFTDIVGMGLMLGLATALVL
jgi:magnesium transporter